MATVTVSRSGDRLVAIKEVPAEQAAEIEREAELLRRLEHPGIVRFVDLVDTPGGGRALHTEFVSSDTWATRPLTDPAQRAAGMAALAAVVAELHDLGVSHLRLTGGHVLHGEDDRPVLCGLARAGDATPENRRTDLAALADLCHDETVGRGPLTGKLSSLADATRAGRLGARDLARRLDQLLAKRSPGSEPARGDRADRPDLLKRVPRRARYAGAALLAAAAAMALSGFWSRGPSTTAGEPPEGATPAFDAAPSPGGAQPSNGTGTTGLEAAGPTGFKAADLAGAASVQALAPSAADNSGDPTRTAPPAGARLEPEPVAGSGPPAPETADAPGIELAAIDAAEVLEHRGRRYAIGLEGDLVATGDWDCDGTATPVIVRPATGDVVLFDGWPEPGETVSMPVRWKVDSPTDAEVVTNDSCDLLRVYTAAGSQLLDPRRMP